MAQPNVKLAVELVTEMIESERAKPSTKYNAEVIGYGREILKALTGTSQIPTARKAASESVDALAILRDIVADYNDAGLQGITQASINKARRALGELA